MIRYDRRKQNAQNAQSTQNARNAQYRQRPVYPPNVQAQYVERPSLGKKILRGLGTILAAFFNIRIQLKYVILVLLLIVGGSVGYTYKTMLDDMGGKEDYDEAKRYIEIKDVVEDRYIDEVSRGDLGNYAAAAMISGLKDPWSYFMSADEYKTYQLYSSSEYDDIGMTMIEAAGGGFQVVSVNNASPAAWAGLSAGMVITSVDGENITKSTLDEVRTLIRSKMNTKFTLGIGNGKTVIEVDCSTTYVSPVNYRLEKTEAGYVQILNFEAGSAQDAINAIETLMDQGAVALCIDLRGNPGGLTSELRQFLDYLMPNCTLFYEEDKDGNRTPYDSDSMCVQLPMCVLVNAETFSEAEICAAVLQENSWATVLGEATTGKTRTQETIQLADGSAIRLSTKTYITARGTDISRNGGIVPNYIVYNSDSSATGTTMGTTGGDDGTASVSNDEQLIQALKMLS